MSEVFADTFYWLALLKPNDSYHERALNGASPGPLVTSWAVQLEVMDAFSEVRNRPLAVRFWQETSNDPSLVLIALDSLLLARAASFFAQRPDKNWSYTDCISFLIMQDRGISEAMTGDHHFEQAGFRALLK